MNDVIMVMVGEGLYIFLGCYDVLIGIWFMVFFFDGKFLEKFRNSNVWLKILILRLMWYLFNVL